MKLVLALLSLFPLLPTATSAAQANDEQLVEELRTLLDDLEYRDTFSGTVLVARGRDVLFSGAYGAASKRFGVANEIDTKFNLGSMNKMFTATCIMQLAEAGKLVLDGPIADYLPSGWLADDVAQRIQVKHLLTHSSGLGGYFGQEFVHASKANFRELDDYKALIYGDTCAFEPGTQWQYSNSGFFLLGVIVQHVSGQNYFDYVREHIYAPAGMKNSDSYEMDRPVPNLAIGYTREGLDGSATEAWRNNLYMHVLKGGPAGGGFSTVEDLHRFALALKGGKLVSKDGFEQLTRPKPELSSPTYGYGFSLVETPTRKAAGHGGGFPGISASLNFGLTDERIVAVLSNYDGGASQVALAIAELMEKHAAQ